MFFCSEAYVLNKEKIGEKDLLLELLTPSGKILSIAKGAQKSKRRFVNVLEEFNFIYAHFRKKGQEEIPILEVADLKYLPENLRKDYSKFLLFSYINEVLSQVSYPKLEVEYFFWIKEFLKLVNELSLESTFKVKALEILKSYFEWNFMGFLGWKPQLDYCVSCYRVIQRLYYFSIPLGGILCINCKDGESFLLDQGVIELLRKFIKIPINLKEFLSMLTFSEVKTLIELGEKYVSYFLSYKGKSLRILKEALSNGKIS
ncbi:MAG: DNA repair protein RecO [Thermodesulfobacteriaceae bacterium]|nr:DNA repair protein RecO [Thermodesulfobacteriaceae bacterium]